MLGGGGGGGGGGGVGCWHRLDLKVKICPILNHSGVTAKYYVRFVHQSKYKDHIWLTTIVSEPLFEGLWVYGCGRTHLWFIYYLVMILIQVTKGSLAFNFTFVLLDFAVVVMSVPNGFMWNL